LAVSFVWCPNPLEDIFLKTMPLCTVPPDDDYEKRVEGGHEREDIEGVTEQQKGNYMKTGRMACFQKAI
jgi:hypothetical protein